MEAKIENNEEIIAKDQRCCLRSDSSSEAKENEVLFPSDLHACEGQAHDSLTTTSVLMTLKCFFLDATAFPKS